MSKHEQFQTSLSTLLVELDSINKIWKNLRNYPKVNMNIFIAYRYSLPNTILDYLLLPRLSKFRRILKESFLYENVYELLLQCKEEYTRYRQNISDYNILKNAIENRLDAYDVLPEFYLSFEKYALFVYYNLLFEKEITINEALLEFESIRSSDAVINNEMIYYFYENKIINKAHFHSVFSKYNLQFLQEFIDWYVADKKHQDYTYYKIYHGKE